MVICYGAEATVLLRFDKVSDQTPIFEETTYLAMLPCIPSDERCYQSSYETSSEERRVKQLLPITLFDLFGIFLVF